MHRGLDLLDMNLQSSPHIEHKNAVTVANEQNLKKQGSVTKKRKFVIVSCLLSSKHQFRFRFGLKIF